MANVFDYLEWRGDLSFAKSPWNEIDSLILALICYVDFGDIWSDDDRKSHPTLLSAAKRYFKFHSGETAKAGLIVPSDVMSVTAKAAKTRRFGMLKIADFVNEINEEDETQFCAMSFLSDDGSIFVVFRGTDDTIVGWKENFNMSFMLPVPAQIKATEYLQREMRSRRGDFYVSGHSKGGNLAVYAATMCPENLKKRIRAVYNNDGPGFNREFVESEEYVSIRDKVRTLVPESSVVGMLLEHEEIYEVVKSNSTGLLQHNGFSWQLLGNKFIYLDEISEESKKIDETVKRWLSETEPEKRRAVVDSVYEILTSDNIKTLTELNSDKLKIIKAWGSLDAESRGYIIKILKALIGRKK
ncbi:MAG: DUF2974 domain-containing protein [Clostridia bacterium]|nr:DUF2974 domain-containing protein [Clostridia bacterium]